MTEHRSVVVVHTEDGLRDQVPAAIEAQGYEPITMLTSSHDPFAYASVLRKLWRHGGDFVLVEQDVVPPPGALERLFTCRHSWCSHPHWVGTHHTTTTTGLVRWSSLLRAAYPYLMDLVCAAPEPRYWVRMGWTRLPRDCSVATLNGPGRRACLLPSAPREATSDDERVRPTTHDWRGIDSDLSYKLSGLGVNVHVHPVPTIHLHDYAADPNVDMFRWWDRPYDPAEWPQG